MAAMRKELVELNINGESYELAIVPTHTLLEVLREDAVLTGTKHGCEQGECGLCTVLVDGSPQFSCLTLAVDVQGSAIRTVEGLARGGELHPLQRAFAEKGASQCGYCSPGMLMSAQALLEQQSGADPERDSRGAGGQPLPLYRLSRHRRGRRARGGAPAERGVTAVTTDPRQTSARGTAAVGGSDPRIDVHAKTTGQTMYADDIHLPRMLIGRLLRSPYRHAKILRVDVTQAAALPGVHGILTGPDLPIRYGIMPVAQDEHALALHKVRYHGEPVAAVAAIDEEAAEQALRLIEVEYEELAPVSSIEDAIKPGLPLIDGEGLGRQVNRLRDARVRRCRRRV